MAQEKNMYVGTLIKLFVAIDCEGFDINTDPWQVTVSRGDVRVKTYRPNDGARYSDEDQSWFILVDTSYFGSGKYKVIVKYKVPDSDVPDGFRPEVNVHTLPYIYAV